MSESEQERDEPREVITIIDPRTGRRVDPPKPPERDPDDDTVTR